MNQIFRNIKGFTLIEIAIALVIIGLLLGMGTKMIGPLMVRAKTTETNDILNAAVESIVGNALVTKKLPRWTDLNNASILPNEFHYSLRNCKDARGNPLFYAYDDDLFTTNICTKTTTNLTVRKCNDSACTTFTDTSNVAFIVYSRGENFNYQTIMPVGATSASPATAFIYDRDVDMGTNRVSGAIPIPNNISPPGNSINDPADSGCAPGEAQCQYDDLVRYMTLNELKTKIGCTSVDTCSTITLTNNTGITAYYKKNGIDSGQWTSPLVVGTTDYCDIFSDVAYTTKLCPVSITFFHLSNFDVNRNCNVQMAPGCSLADQ